MAAGVALPAGFTPAQASALCTPTQNTCNFNDAVTTSHIQIGGQGSTSGESPNRPAELSDGSIAEAWLGFSYDRLTGILTLTVSNPSVAAATATGIFFNVPPQITNLTLLSHDGSGLWELAFDANRADGVVDSDSSMDYIRTQGFGVFSAFLGNNGTDTSKEAGNPESEVQAGAPSVTFQLQVDAPNVSDFNACSFTSINSTIPPGDKLVIGLVRFQGGPDLGYGLVTPCSGPDLLVSLASFEPTPGDASVELSWLTASENNNAGFAILRREVRGGKVDRLNSQLIVGQGGEFSGYAYSFVDTTAQNGRKYHYMLEDWDLNGSNTIHPPKRAVPNPQNPPIKLRTPAYEEKAGLATRLGWESRGAMKYVVEISADPGFPARGTFVISNGRRADRALSRRELNRIQAMGNAGTEGGVYWRVVGTSAGPRGRGPSPEHVSDVFFLVTN
jgi:hypothetical protein